VFRLPPLTPFVKKLLIALSTTFVVVAIVNRLVYPVLELLWLETRVLSIATLWQVFTYVLVLPPTSLFPLLLSLLFIWWILPPFEERYGPARVFQLALIGTLGSALLALLAGVLFPGSAAPVSGPGPITLAAMSAYAVLLPPYAEVSFFGVLPMKARQLLWVIFGFSLLGFLTSWSATHLASDIGAIGAGVAFVKFWMQKPPRRRTFDRKPGKPSKLRVVGRDDEKPGSGWLN
jgi:membrane associated rhomboid family serine protease